MESSSGLILFPEKLIEHGPWMGHDGAMVHTAQPWRIRSFASKTGGPVAAPCAVDSSCCEASNQGFEECLLNLGQLSTDNSSMQHPGKTPKVLTMQSCHNIALRLEAHSAQQKQHKRSRPSKLHRQNHRPRRDSIRFLCSACTLDFTIYKIKQMSHKLCSSDL